MQSLTELPPKPEFSPEGDLLNWIEIETWGTMNSRTWNDVVTSCRHAKHGELIRLRVLASMLLYEVESCKALVIEAAMTRTPIVKP